MNSEIKIQAFKPGTITNTANNDLWMSCIKYRHIKYRRRNRAFWSLQLSKD